jgi:hypothetical protein
MSEYNQEDPKGAATLRKEERKQERLKAKTRAFRDNMRKTLAEALKGTDQKAALARDMLDAKNHPERVQQMKDQTWGGTADDCTGYGDIPEALRHRDDDDELI